MAAVVTAIDVERLLSELAEQRRSGVATTSMNLVAYVEGDPDLLRRMTQRIEELAERNVSRTLLLSSDDLEHQVRSHSCASGDTMITRSEHVQLTVKNLGAAEIRSIVHDLLVPNVRTVLLWGGEHLTDSRFLALADIADIVVLFSSARNPGTASLREILELDGSAVEPKVRDLAFLRLLPWQDTIAEFFDDADLASELPRISRVRVVSGSAPEAYYLIGWLSSRLSWEACGSRELCNAQGQTISIDVHLEGLPRRISGVELHAANCVFGASARDGGEIICLTVKGEKSRPARCTPLRDLDIASAIERAIFMPSSEMYVETLRIVRRLLEHDDG